MICQSNTSEMLERQLPWSLSGVFWHSLGLLFVHISIISAPFIVFFYGYFTFTHCISSSTLSHTTGTFFIIIYLVYIYTL